MEKRTTKSIMFNSYEEAERFCNLYELSTVLINSTDSHIGNWEKEYYDLRDDTKYIVHVRRTNSEMKSIVDAIGIKKIKRNNHIIYMYN